MPHNMPQPEFIPMRRTDRQLSEGEALGILSEGIYGTLCTIGENGYPSGTPLNYADDGGNIYVHLAAGNALFGVRHNQKVGFTVVTRADVIPHEFVTNYESAMVYGAAEELHGREKFDALHLLVKKYCADIEKDGVDYIREDIDNCHVLRIRIEHITGKARRPAEV